MRPALEGIVLFTILARDDPLRRAEAARPDPRQLHRDLRLARIAGEFFREPDPQLGFLWGGLTMGMLLSVPMIIAGMHPYCRGMARERRKPPDANQSTPFEQGRP